MPELSSTAQTAVLLRIAQPPVLLPAKTALSLIVFCPEETLHPRCHNYLTAFVVDASIRTVAPELNTVTTNTAPQATTKATCIYQSAPATISRPAAALPRLTEKTLTLEVPVKLLAKLNLNVTQYPTPHLIHYISHTYKPQNLKTSKP